VRDPMKKKMDGEPVRYGDEVLLVDDDGLI
jgi:hypothetical protein